MFQFKQFTIHQDKCAMKVSTDACILGAYAPVTSAKHILDIGTGTGLLALMMAQRSTALIDAVELDQYAFEQAYSNVRQSMFSHRINLHQGDIQTFAPAHLYDCIVSNPPFYQNHLKSDKRAKNMAHHTDTLSFEALLTSVWRLLDEQGIFVVLLPDYEMGLLRKLCEAKGLFLQQSLCIRHRAGSKILRKIGVFRKQKQAFITEELHIKDAQEQYTEAFKALLQAYYLIF